jgi:hypothetical protein
MIFEDGLANGVGKTLFDMSRGLWFGLGHLNNLLGLERGLSEIGSILTDCISPGLLAQGVGSAADKHLGTFTTNYLQQATLGHAQAHWQQANKGAEFATVLESIVKHWSPTAEGLNPQAQHVAELVTPDRLATLLTSDEKTGKLKLNNPALMALAANLKTPLGLSDSLAVVLHPPKATGLPPASLPLPTLLGDMAYLQHHLADKPQQALKLLGRTQYWKKVQIAQLIGSMGLTIAVPFAIKSATRALTGGDTYPGEAGLKVAPTGPAYQQGYFGTGTNPQGLAQVQAIQPPSFWQRTLPYVSGSLAKGNPLPLLGSALPLVFATGLFRTGDRAFVLPTLGKEVTTLAKGLVRLEPSALWRRNWWASLDFERGFPFTTQQQMAMLFAGLISSRLLTARSPNEYRERATDGGLGWSLWILGSPTLRPLMAKHLFEGGKYELLKTIPAAQGASRLALRSATEVELLAADALKAKGISVEAAKQQLSRVSAAAFALNIGLLGLVEPFISMGLTWLADTKPVKETSA